MGYLINSISKINMGQWNSDNGVTKISSVIEPCLKVFKPSQKHPYITLLMVQMPWT